MRRFNSAIFNSRPRYKDGDVVVTAAPLPRMILCSSEPVQCVFQDGLFYPMPTKGEDATTRPVIHFKRPLHYLEVFPTI